MDNDNKTDTSEEETTVLKVSSNSWGVISVKTDKFIYRIDCDMRDGDYYIAEDNLKGEYQGRYASNFETKSEALSYLLDDLLIAFS